MAEAGEFQDWEMLQKTDMGLVQTPYLSQNSRDFEGVEGDSEGAIRSDYFTLENSYAKEAPEGDREGSSVESDNPSWVDPASEPRYAGGAKSEVGFGGIELSCRNSGEFWSDSGSDSSVGRKFGDFDGKGELDCGDDGRREVDFEGIGAARKNSGDFWSDTLKFKDFLGKGEMSFEGIGIKRTNSSEFWSDSSGDDKFRGTDEEIELGSGDFLKMGDGSESGGVAEVEEGERLDSDGFVEGEGGGETDNLVTSHVKSVEAEKKKVVWWKLPLELLKFCAFRISPVWSFSIAAAVMGFVILGRRLYRMKRKSRSIPLKVSLDDKKVTHFMTRAARLNEAFSMVKRAPIVRASLPPVGGVTPWPVMGLR
ncbi:uncharacterized protein LOC131236705 [Magnolia sinica]|uniref:uncharacterized protein LOC131236705 n=1 Tax=Magnolia sinica TaxID=86752 RepID=UPI002659C860|nr:uncharacterized protein LOC131236705 [Magnolia sinica]